MLINSLAVYLCYFRFAMSFTRSFTYINLHFVFLRQYLMVHSYRLKIHVHASSYNVLMLMDYP